MSTHYTDGYRDAQAGRRESPPAPLILSGGRSTSVHRQEYIAGYRQAQADALSPERFEPRPWFLMTA